MDLVIETQSNPITDTTANTSSHNSAVSMDKVFHPEKESDKIDSKGKMFIFAALINNTEVLSFRRRRVSNSSVHIPNSPVAENWTDMDTDSELDQTPTKSTTHLYFVFLVGLMAFSISVGTYLGGVAAKEIQSKFQTFLKQ